MKNPHVESEPTWHPWAAIAGWVVPGLGHALIGQKTRAIILAVTIGSLWLGGFLIGGICVFDQQEHPAWFLGQVLVGPSLAANAYLNHQKLRFIDGKPSPDRPYAYEPSYGRVNEQGILYTALAGLLNLLALLDVVYRQPRSAKDAGKDHAGPARPADPPPVAAPALLLPLLAYRPFLDPLPLHEQWLAMLLPLVIAISVVYKTIKLEHLSELPRQAALLSAQILAFMVLVAAALLLLTEML
ncbi:MAG: hypothetical protein IT440_01760 [Phycisphaeraceae bacterium]|nr:hypothetical protein [Phycisphaeraceae bacterium]